MIINNFDTIREHLTFQPAMKFDAKTKKLKQLNDTYDRYIVQILARAKDAGGKKYGVNTSNRLIKTYEISSLDYFDKKRDHIIDLCEKNHARAYIHPQVRATYDCLKEMLKITLDNLENPTIKFQHILRSALCKMHKSRDPKWILDLDNDEMYGWTVEQIMLMVAENLEECKKNPKDLYLVPTRNGTHIITTPFNLKEVNDECYMMFEGTRRGASLEVILDALPDSATQESAKLDWATHTLTPFNYHEWLIEKFGKTNPSILPMVQKIQKNLHEITGWVHKDGMTLLYANI